MRSRWRPFAAVFVVVAAAGILAAVAAAQTAITITTLQARANGTTITSGPMGAGYDIRIVANVSETSWQSTSWRIGSVLRCVNHADQNAGNNREVVLEYEYEANPALREPSPERDLPDPGKVGPGEHVFAPPPGATTPLRVELFNNQGCSGAPLASRELQLTARVPGPNQPLVAACADLNVAVVLDESYSIHQANATQNVRDATRALAEGLLGTGASMAVFKFSTTASSSFIPPYQQITQSFIDNQLRTYLEQYNPARQIGYTNWDAGLTQARTQTQSNPPDLVVFLTDGNPNRYGAGATLYEEGYYLPMSPAADVADLLKERSHLFAIGVGVGVTDALSALRIQAVSGTRSFPEHSIETADYTLITDFNELEEALADLASNLCNVTVTVRKETDEQQADSWVYKPAWPFSGGVLLQPPASQFAYRWFEPGTAGPPVTSGTATQSGTTQTNGTLDFVWRPTSAAALSSITISETVPPAYAPQEVKCTSGTNTIFASTDPATVRSFTLQGLKVRDHVYCYVRNRLKRSTVQVVKNWVGTPSSATIFVDRDGTAPYDASKVATSSGESTSFDYPISTPATVGETTVPAGYRATIECGAGLPQPYNGGPFPVTAPAEDGATLTCTITNIQNRSTVRVVKQWEGAPASTTIFVDRDGSAPFDASTVATANGDSASFTYPTSTPVFVGETPIPAGYGATIRCGQGPAQPYTGGPFPVTAPSIPDITLTCTITNKQQFSTVRVVKDWVGAPAATTIFVDQTGVAPFDASVVNPADGASASFDYPVSTPAFVGETAVPAGYSATIDCGQGPQPYAGGPFAVTSPATDGDVLTCTIINTQLFSTVRVVKNWSGTPATAEIFVDLDGVAPFDASTIATETGDHAEFDYPVSTGAFVGETTVPAGYEATIQCGGAAPTPYTGGPFAVTSPTTGGATLTCTITNFLIPPPATVRVVKTWDGAPSSTTIFVDEDGIPPFDASTVATADGDNTSFDYVAGTPVTVGETAVPTGYEATIQCGGAAPQPYAGGPFDVIAPAAGATLTCTITNRQLLSTVRVIKQWVGAPSSATIFVDQDGTAPYDASTVATASGQSASFTYPVGTPVTVGETAVPAGYRATIHCGLTREAPQPYEGGPFPVTAPTEDGATLSCTITNIQLFSTVRVVKVWIGDPASATIFVDQDGTAPFDASTVATATGDSASFEYPVGTPVTVGETGVPAGYRATIHCGRTPEAPQPYAGGPFPVTAPTEGDAIVTCEIVNIQLRSTVQVVKNWAGGAASATLFVDANGTQPFDASTVATASGEGVSLEYPVSTPVFVGETGVPDGYTATIDCGGGPQAYTGGPFPVTSPVVDGDTVTCTITNTPHSTVRVLKYWAGPPRPTTIFVDSVGQPPFDVSTLAYADGQDVSFDYPLSTPVTVGEIGVPPGYRAFINCGTGPQDIRRYSGGPHTVVSPGVPNGVLNCTITNVRRITVPGRLVIVKTARPRVVRAPARINFRMKVTNRGPGIVRNVRVCDRVPSGLIVLRAPGARRVNGSLCWQVRVLRPRRSRNYVVVARVVTNGPRTYVNVVSISGTNSANCPSPAFVARRQQASCTARARVVVLAARRRPAPRPPFTG